MTLDWDVCLVPLVKSMEEYFNFEEVFLEENEELLLESILFEED